MKHSAGPLAYVAAVALALSAPAHAATAGAKPPPLPEEEIGKIERLPADYPAHWVLVHDFHFNALVDGRVAVVDTHDAALPLKGLVRAAQFANMLHSRSKGEIYTSETFFTRLTRGERTDAITIWDTSTLEPKGEIILPGGKRQQSVT